MVEVSPSTDVDSSSHALLMRKLVIPSLAQDQVHAREGRQIDETPRDTDVEKNINSIVRRKVQLPLRYGRQVLGSDNGQQNDRSTVRSPGTDAELMRRNIQLRLELNETSKDVNKSISSLFKGRKAHIPSPPISYDIDNSINQVMVGKTKLSQLVEIEEHAGLVAGIQMKNVFPNTNWLGFDNKEKEVREAPPFTTGEAPYVVYTQNSFESSISSLDNEQVSVAGGGKYRYGYDKYNPVATTRSQPVQDAIPVNTQLLATQSRNLQGHVSLSDAPYKTGQATPRSIGQTISQNVRPQYPAEMDIDSKIRSPAVDSQQSQISNQRRIQPTASLRVTTHGPGGPTSPSSANGSGLIVPSPTQKLDVVDERAQVAGTAHEVAKHMSQGQTSSAQSHSPKSQYIFASPTQSVSDRRATPAAPTRQSPNKFRGTAHATSSLFQGSRFPGVAHAVAPASSFTAFEASSPRSRDSYAEAPTTGSGSAPIDLKKRISNAMKRTTDITSTPDSRSEAIDMDARIASVMKRTTDMSAFIEETRRMATAGSQLNPERKEVLSPRQTQQYHLLRNQQADVYDQRVYLEFVPGEVVHMQPSPSMYKRQAHRSVQPPSTWSPHMNPQEYHPAYREPSPAAHTRNARSIPGESPRVCLPPSEMSRSSQAQRIRLHHHEPSLRLPGDAETTIDIGTAEYSSISPGANHAGTLSAQYFTFAEYGDEDSMCKSISLCTSSFAYNDDRILRYAPYEKQDVSDFGHGQQQSYEESRVHQRFLPSQTCRRGYANEKSLHYQGFDGEYQPTENQYDHEGRFCGYEQFYDGEDPERMEYHEDDQYDLVADSRHHDIFPDDRVFGEVHAHGRKVESVSPNLVAPSTFDFWRQATASESMTGGLATRTSTSAAPKITTKATKYANDRSRPSSTGPGGRYIKNERIASPLQNIEQV